MPDYACCAYRLPALFLPRIFDLRTGGGTQALVGDMFPSSTPPEMMYESRSGSPVRGNRTFQGVENRGLAVTEPQVETIAPAIPAG
jgi:hypothetical protein